MIELKNLTKTYNSTPAVNHLSFTVEKGEVFGFIGPNGAGKTTTIRVLATLLEPTSGTARIAGHCVVNYPEKVREALGFMPDRFGVYEGIQVWEYLEFFAAAYKLPRKDRRIICDQVMELTDLTPLKDKMVSALSKGMRQRLCLARTLIHDPDVLVLDEPAAGLDPRARIEFRALLAELADMGKTIFISSHILTELSDICTLVGIIEKGDLLAFGDVNSIARSLSSAQVLHLEVAGQVEEAVVLLHEVPEVVRAVPEGRKITVEFQGEESDIPAILKKLLLADVPIIGLEREQHDLEDLFMQITKGELA